MNKDYYDLAFKAGQKQYKADLAQGKDPHLPALEQMLPVSAFVNAVDLGCVQIPTQFIAGTMSATRTNTFASDFMPLAPENSEFASKWKNLCRSHLEEGIHDPIKAYEYRNRYYVEEGNKRVSVLRFFEAVSVFGEVTRILPERDGSEEIERYYAYVAFYGITKINFLEFSKRGSYRLFLKLLGRERAEDWDDDVVKKVRTDYYYFQKAFREQGGDKLEVNCADAMLRYMMIYGYDSLRGKSESQMREMLAKVWKELTLLQEEQPIDVIEAPDSASSAGLVSKSAGLVSKLIPPIPWLKPVLPVLYLYGKDPEQSNWVLGHEKGRQEAQERLREKIESSYVVCATEEAAEAAMRQALEQGTKVIFVVASEYLNVCLKVAVDYPQAAILNCSLNVPHRYIRTYYPRMYEAKFISGAISGAMCTNGKIGYINNYPVFGNIAEINAFARGVQLSNAHAKVYLEWANDESLHGTAQKLIDQGIRLISVRNRTHAGGREKELFGLQLVEGSKVTELVAPIWNWGSYYEKILLSILDGSYQSQENKHSKSLNYYWGMSSDVVDIEFSDALPGGTRYLGELIQKAIRMGVCRPFYRPERDDAGNVKWHDTRTTICMEEIIRMDWLEPNVVGSIPAYHEIPDRAKKLVNAVGVPSARKDPELDL